MLVCALLCALQSAPARAAGSEQCGAQLVASIVRVHIQHAIPRVTYKHSAREIWHQLGGHRNGVALGLTASSTSLSLDAVLHEAVSGDGQTTCARPEIDVTLGHAKLEVLLASEIEQDDCVARVVLSHELKHVAIEREALEWAGEMLEKTMQRYYRDRVYSGTDHEISTQIAQEFQQRWTPALETLAGLSLAKHREHDERDVYADTNACEGALVRIGRSVR